jgi:AraC-like DNA-binding protein
MKMSQLVPSAVLRPYISRYWSWTEEPQLPPLLPGGGCELFFYDNQTVDIIRSDGERYGKPASALLSPRSARFRFRSPQAVSFISVRFRIGALHHFCPMPIGELIDTGLTAGDVWGVCGERLQRQVANADGMVARVAAIENFLIKQLDNHYKIKRRWLDPVFNDLFYQMQSMGLDELIERSNVGTRQFQRVFKLATGVSPKYFQRIVRTEAVVRQMLLLCRKDYLDAALQNGYYDQSHFIKDCRHFTGVAPGHFFHDANFKSHFYNSPLTK